MSKNEANTEITNNEQEEENKNEEQELEEPFDELEETDELLENENNEEASSNPEGEKAANPLAQRMRERMAEMEEEQRKLKELQQQVEAAMASSPTVDSKTVDARSVYVGNVDYSGTLEDLQAHFSSCGTINRVTILCDKFTGKPKGFAYIEFVDESSVAHACLLNESLFRGRPLKVIPKRTNLPGISSTNRRPRRVRSRFSSAPRRRRPYNNYFTPYP